MFEIIKNCLKDWKCQNIVHFSSVKAAAKLRCHLRFPLLPFMLTVVLRRKLWPPTDYVRSSWALSITTTMGCEQWSRSWQQRGAWSWSTPRRMRACCCWEPWWMLTWLNFWLKMCHFSRSGIVFAALPRREWYVTSNRSDMYSSNSWGCNGRSPQMWKFTNNTWVFY